MRAAFGNGDAQGPVDVRLDVVIAGRSPGVEVGSTWQRRREGRIEQVTHYATYSFDQASAQARLELHGDTASTLFGTNLFFRFIVWRAMSRGLVPLHAAALGEGADYWLLPGAPGAGKSVATVLARAAGLGSLGDDVVLWNPRSNALYPVYATVRLTPGGLDLVGEYLPAARLRKAGVRNDGKVILTADDREPPGRLAGVLLVDGGPPSPVAAYQQLLSTVALLRVAGVPTAQVAPQLARLARSARLVGRRRDADLAQWSQSLLEVCCG